MFSALQGPTFRTVNPFGVGWSAGFRYPQVKTCGYSRLAPAGPYEKMLISTPTGGRSFSHHQILGGAPH
jgi:hypothetical protein